MSARKLSPRFQWDLRARGRCAAGGQGAVGCDHRATTAGHYGGGRIRLPSCDQHQQQIAAITDWLASYGEDIPACILGELIDRLIRAGNPGYAADFPLDGEQVPPWLDYCREGTGCGHASPA